MKEIFLNRGTPKRDLCVLLGAAGVGGVGTVTAEKIRDSLFAQILIASLADGGCKRYRRRTEIQFSGLRFCVFVAEMPVDLPDQDAAILVTHPAGDRHEVDPAHHGKGDEVMPAVMKAKSLQRFRQHAIS